MSALLPRAEIIFAICNPICVFFLCVAGSESPSIVGDAINLRNLGSTCFA